MTKSNEQIEVWRAEIAAIQAKIDANTPKPEKHPELKDCMKVGNTLWLLPNWTNDRTGYLVEVLSIGRKWVNLSMIRDRCDKSGIISCGRLYPSQQAYKDSCELSIEWGKLSRKIDWNMPKHVTMAEISQICEILGFDDLTKGEK